MAKEFNRPLIIGAALAGAAYLLYRAGALKSFLSTYRVKLGSPSFNMDETKKSYYSKLYINVPLIVENNSAFNGKITGVKLMVSVNGKLVSTVSKSGEAAIAPHSTSTIKVLAGFNTTEIPGLLNTLLKGAQGGSITVGVSGSIDTDQGLINMDLQNIKIL